MSVEEALKKRREQVIDELSDAFAGDALEMAEFERRLAEAHKAIDVPALERQVADLPKRSMGPAAAVAPVVMKPALPAVQQKTVRAILGSVERRGAFSVPQIVTVSSVFGSAVIDLREALLQPGVTEIHVRAIFGNIEIIVPPHLPLEVEGGAILGSFEQISRAPATPDPTAPLVRITGAATLGNVEITTALKKR